MGAKISTSSEDIANYITTIGTDYEDFREKIISNNVNDSIFSLDESEFNKLLEKIGVKEFTQKRVLWVQWKKYIITNSQSQHSKPLMEQPNILTNSQSHESDSIEQSKNTIINPPSQVSPAIMEQSTTILTNSLSKDSELSMEPTRNEIKSISQDQSSLIGTKVNVLTKKITKNLSQDSLLVEPNTYNQQIMTSANLLQANEVKFDDVLIEAKSRFILSNGGIVNLRDNPNLLVGIPGIEELSDQDRSQILKLCVISLMFYDERLFEVKKTKAFCCNSVDSMYMKSCKMKQISIKNTGALNLNTFSHYHDPTCNGLSVMDLKGRIFDYASKNNFQLPESIFPISSDNENSSKPTLITQDNVKEQQNIKVVNRSNGTNEEEEDTIVAKISADMNDERKKHRRGNGPIKSCIRRDKNGKVSVYRSMTDAAKLLFKNEYFRKNISACCEASKRGDGGDKIVFAECTWEFCPYKCYDDDSEYFGEMKNEKRHGYGKYVSTDGSSFEGEWVYDKKHRGCEIFSDGSTFEGDYNNNERVSGIFKYSNGDMYQGGWLNGMKHGQGKMTYANGGFYKGKDEYILIILF